MRIILITAALVLIPFLGIAQDSPMKPDGRMWQNYSDASSGGPLMKGAYVQGAIEGLRAGALLGYLQGRSDEQDVTLGNVKTCIEKGPCATIPSSTFIKTGPEAIQAIVADAGKYRANIAPGNLSVLDVVHQMDKFYADYRNTPVCMIQALQESIRSLNGAAASEGNLEKLRNAGGEGCHL